MKKPSGLENIIQNEKNGRFIDFRIKIKPIRKMRGAEL